jgi:hypothetical protein
VLLCNALPKRIVLLARLILALHFAPYSTVPIVGAQSQLQHALYVVTIASPHLFFDYYLWRAMLVASELLLFG